MAALDGPDFETTRQQLAAFGANRDPDLGTSAVEFLGEQAGALAQHAQSVQESIGRASADWPPSSDSSDQGLNDAAEAIGLSNGAGGYGRRGATAAAGATGQLTGDKGTTYTAGQLAQGPGGVRLKLRSTVSIPAGTGTGQVLGTWDVDSSDANSLGAKGNLLTGVTCLTVLTAVALELTQRGGPSPIVIALIIGTLILAWLFSNLVYALHYAHIFYLQHGGKDRGGIDFPGTKIPDYWDFIYFSFTLGMTFQTSDVEISSGAVRRVVTFHCLAAFVFNLGVIAFTVNVLGGG